MRILSVRATIFGLAAFTIGLLASARAAITLTVGTNNNLTNSSANNAEDCIAINPRNPLNLFMSETWSLATRYSTDGGLTWQDSNIGALGSSVGDVSAAFDTFGNLFLVRFGSGLRIVVGLSTNGGATFSNLYTTSSSNNDQPTVVTGPSSISGQGSVWICYTDSGSHLVAQGANVTGLGTIGSFSAAQATAIGGDFGDIIVGPTGQMAVTYQNGGSGIGPDIIRYALDPDGTGALGFGPVINATATQVGGFAGIPAQPSRTIDSEPGLVWDRSGGPFNGRLYLMYTDRSSTGSDDTDIYVRYSNDNGTNWTAPVRVNDDPVGNGKSQFLPKIALDQTSGYIAVSWYDCRNSPGNNTAEVWATISADGGQTFLPNVKVSAGMSSGTVTAVGTFNFGDYTGLTFHGGTFYPCWADNSNSSSDNPGGTLGTFDIYTARVTVNIPLVMLNPRYVNHTFTVTVRTTAAQTFYLESTDSLAPISWVTRASIAGDGTLHDLTDTGASVPQRFYRISAQ
jgi:hypothetical protein